MVVAVEGSFSKEDIPLNIPDTVTKIDELSVMLSSLQHEVTTLVKEKTTLTINTTLDVFFDSSLMAFISKPISRNAYYAQSCEPINWILDTSATDHISSNKSLFKSL